MALGGVGPLTLVAVAPPVRAVARSAGGVTVAAVGLKTFIVTVGDGTYMFNNPTACHLVSQAYDLPVLTIVCNNAIWHASKAATQQVMPDGWAVSTGNFPLCDLTPTPRYERIVEAHDGYGEMVDDPQEVLPALRRALKAVKEDKRQAVLNVICGTH